MALHEIFDARHDAAPGARLFTCGDFHGCHDELMAGLDAIARGLITYRRKSFEYTLMVPIWRYHRFA